MGRLDRGDARLCVAGGPAVRAAASRVGLELLDQDDPRGALAAMGVDVLLWQAPSLAGGLLNTALAVARQRVVFDVGVGHLAAGALPGQLRRRLQRFDHLLVVDDRGARQLAARDVPADRIHRVGPLHEPICVEPARPEAQQDIADLLGSRPRWLALGVPARELSAVIAAHRQVIRHATQALAVVVPDGLAALDDTRDALRDAGLSFALWSETVDLPEPTEVLLVDDFGPAQVWMRAAPVTYLGGSLDGGALVPGIEAAALGSALVHGTGVDQAVSRLATDGATVAVTDPAGLGPALARLMAPDAAATLARTALEQVTEGAEAVNWVIDLIERAEVAP